MRILTLLLSLCFIGATPVRSPAGKTMPMMVAVGDFNRNNNVKDLNSSYAVLFYITDFRDTRWPRLPDTKREVEAIAAELRNNYNFTVDLVPNPTRQEIRDKIAYWNERVRPDDQVLFFFSTHGHYDERGDEGFLIPADGRFQDTYGDTWLSYNELGRRITLSPSRHVLLALDACYSGAFGIRNKARPGGAPWESQGTLDCQEQIRLATARPSRLYFCSGAKDQRTPARSLFARRWLEALRRGEELGVLRANDLRYFLGRIEYPEPEDGSFTGHQDGDFIFVHKRACSPPPRLSDADHWRQIQPNPTREQLLEHLGEFPGCNHEAQAIALLSGRPAATANPRRTTPGRTGAEKDLPRNPNMIPIQGGVFRMGSNDGDDEKPVHQVEVSDFYLSRYEVTNEEFAAFLNAEGNRNVGGTEWYEIGSDYAQIEKRNNQFVVKSGYEKHPVMEVSWYGAAAYCNWLSREHGLEPVYTLSGSTVTPDWSAEGYRLPTEAEWEYAARGGARGDKWAGTSSERDLANYANGSGSDDGFAQTAPVGSFQPNTFGLYDMSGNVWEWCWDWYDSDYYSKSGRVDPTGPGWGSNRVQRGGSWGDDPADLRCANRGYDGPGSRSYNIGFRLSRAAR